MPDGYKTNPTNLRDNIQVGVCFVHFFHLYTFSMNVTMLTKKKIEKHEKHPKQAEVCIRF